jgi:rod shape determining protein RodA
MLNLYSVSSNASFTGEWSWFIRQGLYLGLALASLALVLVVDYQYLKKIVWAFYGLNIICLVAVALVGTNVNGATRWLDLGLFRFQPSESIKVILVVALAAWFSKRDLSNGLGFRDLLTPAALILLPCILIHKQPDLGTALHLLVTCTPIILAFRFRPQVTITLLATATLVAGLLIALFASGSWPVLLEKGLIKDHQVKRIEAFMDPTKDPSGNGWQTLQSQNAVGGGQLLGRGFMEGPQHKNGFLPEAETDFAFAAMAEEWGFLGCALVLALFLCLLSSGLMLSRRSKDRFGSLIALGLTSLLFWQVVMNVGMVTGLLPVVGIPLPFISYGGTSLVVTVVAGALLLNVGMRRFLFQDEPVQENPCLWQEEASELLISATAPVRRLTADTPFNPEIHPQNRLPHLRPWAKYLRRGRSSMSGWQAPDPYAHLMDD